MYDSKIRIRIRIKERLLFEFNEGAEQIER